MNEWLNSDGWRIVIHKRPAPEVGYWGEVPAMPGCVSQGRTRAECRANVLEAATGCMESYLEFAMQKLGAKRAPLADRHDPFFDEPNATHLRRAIADMDAKRNIVYHDIIEGAAAAHA